MKQILGIDVGGTKVAAGLVDEKLNVTKLNIVETSQTDLLNQLERIIAGFDGYEEIGLSIPGPVVDGGWVKRLPNIQSFQPTNLKQYLSEKFKVPVQIINDANAFTYLEAIKGAGVDKNIVAGIVLGTGTGVGVVINQKIIEGKDGLVGEVDHVVMPDGKLLREYVKASRPFLNAKAAEGYLRTLLSFVVLSFNPDVIVLSGGWSQLEGMEEMTNQLALNVGGYENQTPVVISQFQYPSLLGAALLALNRNQ